MEPIPHVYNYKILIIIFKNYIINIIYMTINNNNQNLLTTINTSEVNGILKNQKLYNICNISLSMLSHFINIASVILSFISTNNNDRNYSIAAGILSAVLTVIISSQRGLTNTINNNNKTLNQYITELKNNQNIVISTTTPITPTISSNNLINTPINTPINNSDSS